MCVDVLLYDVTNSLIYKSPADDIAKYSSRKCTYLSCLPYFSTFVNFPFYMLSVYLVELCCWVNNNTYCINVDMISVLIGLSFFCWTFPANSFKMHVFSKITANLNNTTQVCFSIFSYLSFHLSLSRLFNLLFVHLFFFHASIYSSHSFIHIFIHSSSYLFSHLLSYILSIIHSLASFLVHLNCVRVFVHFVHSYIQSFV